MQWKKSKASRYRHRNKYLYLPLTIGDTTKWLTTASWVEEWVESGSIMHGDTSGYVPITWVEESE